MTRNDPKTTLLMTSVTKYPHPQTKKCFFQVQSTRLADPFIQWYPCLELALVEQKIGHKL